MKITIFGGTGGLGSQILRDSIYAKIDRLGSRDCDLNVVNEISNYFYQDCPDIVIFFNNLNINGFLHKMWGMEIYRLIQTNIAGTTYATTQALKSMRDKGYGRIIYASSITVDKNVMGTSIYASTKAYYENLVKTISLENASKGITANCIQLGYMDGGLTYTLPPEFIEQKKKEIPAGRLGKIDEIDKTINFLIDNEYVNGTTIKLTGGL
jgi:NAD(P)-dependent dehydrogenase (short-subunit alcohol dehydrogenase family)